MNKKILLKTLLPISVVALIGGGIASSLTLTSCSNESEKALEINVSTPTITSNGTTLNISGSCKAFNFNSSTIEFASGTSQWFGELSVNYVDKTFATTLSSEAPNGGYDLRLVANNTIYSNEIHFTVMPFAASDGSNWAGHTSGTVRMSFNVENLTATISGNRNYAAENLVIPEYVFANGKFYKVTSIGNSAFEASLLTGSLTIPNSVTSIGERAFAGLWRLTGSLTIPDSVISIGIGAFATCIGFIGSLNIPDSVISIGIGAFGNCSGFTNITLANFSEEPSWTGTDIFTYFRNVGTVSISGDGDYTAGEALIYLIEKGLPSTWTVA